MSADKSNGDEGDAPTKASVGLRARKKLASKIAGSKPGRNIIVMFLGERGPEIISALKHSVAKHKGAESAGKDLKENIYKFALKAKLMGDEEQFDLKLVNKYSEPMLIFLRQMVRALRYGENFGDDDEKSGALATARRPASPKANSPPDLAQLSKDFNTVAGYVSDLMDPHMQEKNQLLLKDTFALVGNEAYFKDMLENAEYKEWKRTIGQHLHSLMLYGDEKYALEMHNVIISQSEFGDRYSAVIRTVRDFWRKIEDDEPLKGMVGLSIFGKLVENHHEYYNTLGDCKYGDNPEQQYTKFLDLLSLAFKQLDDWPTLCKKLTEIGTEHAVWAPKFPVEAYKHMQTAVHAGCKDHFGADYTRHVHKSMDVIMNLMSAVLRDAY